MSIKRIKREDVVLTAIDFQEKLLPAMFEADKTEASAIKLAAGLDVMGIPKLVTTQYEKGLGKTVAPVVEALGEFQPIDKNTFSAWANKEYRDALKRTERKTVIIMGIETHICVEQTALDLLENGFTVFVPADCVQSRNPANRELSLRRMEEAGVVVTCGESILYELLGSSGAAEFKAVSAIIK